MYQDALTNVYLYKKYTNPEGVKLDERSSASSPRILLRHPLSGLCTLCVSREAAVHKCIAPRRRSYRLYVYRLSAHRTHGCPADTRESHLRRSAPHRARPDAAGGGRARERLTPTAAEGVRGREGATRPVARQRSHSLHLRGARGTLTLRLHCPKGKHTPRLHRPKGKMRQQPPPRAGAENKRARAPHDNARHRTKPPPTRQTATTAAAAARTTTEQTRATTGAIIQNGNFVRRRSRR